MTDIKRRRVAAGWTAQMAVEVMKPIAPGMDKQLLSKAENPKRYGVRLTHAAKQRLCEAIGGDLPNVCSRRTRRRFAQVALTEGQFFRLQQHVRNEGLTVQGVLSQLVDKFLEGVGA